MSYADNIDKRRGIDREPLIAKRILEMYLQEDKNSKMQKSSLLEDMREKYDYLFTVGEKKVKIDVKSGTSFTVIDTLGRETLKHSESDWIVFELSEYDKTLLWVKTSKLKECLEIYPPILNKSKYNESKYIFIEDYIRRNKEYLGMHVQYTK